MRLRLCTIFRGMNLFNFSPMVMTIRRTTHRLVARGRLLPAVPALNQQQQVRLYHHPGYSRPNILRNFGKNTLLHTFGRSIFCNNLYLKYCYQIKTGNNKNLFPFLKGLSHEIFTVIFWLEWIDLGLNENRYWFLIFKEDSSILGSYFKY